MTIANQKLGREHSVARRVEQCFAVASLVARQKPPPKWLRIYLARAGEAFVAEWIERTFPTKLQMKDRLLKVQKAALLIKATLDDSLMVQYLNMRPQIPMQCRPEVQVEMENFVRRTKFAIEAPWMSIGDGRTRKRPEKALPPGDVCPKDHCATIITVAWFECNDSWPSPQSPTVGKAAHLFWTACGGKRIPRGEDPATGWRRHFADARLPYFSSLREKYRHCLNEIKRDLSGQSRA